MVWKLPSHDPFGIAQAQQDPDQDCIATDIPLRFAGQVFDADTGLHYNYFRDYDPWTGRYIQSDPIGLEGGGEYLYWLFAGSSELGYPMSTAVTTQLPTSSLAWPTGWEAVKGLIGQRVIVGGAAIGGAGAANAAQTGVRANDD